MSDGNERQQSAKRAKLLGLRLSAQEATELPSPQELNAVVRKVLSRRGVKVPEIPSEVLAFRRTVGLETDRGCAMTVAAYLEVELGRLIQSRLVDDPSVVEELLGIRGAISTFSARIDVAYALGLIAPTVRRDLNLIRKIRNDFAHSPVALSFENQPLRSRCKELRTDILQEELPPRQKYVRVGVGLLAVIHATLLTTTHRPTVKDIQIHQKK